MSENNGLVVITGNSNRKLVDDICEHMDVDLTETVVKRFSDGETSVDIQGSIRSKDVFIIQSTCPPVNENLMELLIMIDAVKRASAKRVTAVIPYFGYARQDRKSSSRAPITAKLVANLITKAGTDRILTMDLHAGQIQGFFDIPVDNLFAKPVMFDHIKSVAADNLCIVSPDAGGVERARAYAELLGAHMAIIDKRREVANKSKVMNIIGNVKKKTCLIIDDIVDTAGTLTNAADALIAKKATKVAAYCVHPVLSGEAIEKINKSELERLVVTNSIPLMGEAAFCGKITSLSIAGLLGKAIKRIHEGRSVSELFI